MIRKKSNPSDIAVPQNVYRHLQAGFAESNARRCVEYDRDRLFIQGMPSSTCLGGCGEGLTARSRQERVLHARSWLTTSPP
jgi:hypothetical protein